MRNAEASRKNQNYKKRPKRKEKIGKEKMWKQLMGAGSVLTVTIWGKIRVKGSVAGKGALWFETE